MREDGRVGERWEGWRKGGSGKEEWREEEKAGREEGAEGVGRGKQWQQAEVSPTGQGWEERNQPERR